MRGPCDFWQHLSTLQANAKLKSTPDLSEVNQSELTIHINQTVRVNFVKLNKVIMTLLYYSSNGHTVLSPIEAQCAKALV